MKIKSQEASGTGGRGPIQKGKGWVERVVVHENINLRAGQAIFCGKKYMGGERKGG